MIKNLWVFDFDGTLSRIVPDRYAARLHPLCRTMLAQLAATESFYTAILSSRTLDDLLARIDIQGIALGGNGGAEWLLTDGTRTTVAQDRLTELQAVRTLLLPELKHIDQIEGVDIEDKKLSIAVHVRQVSGKYRRFIQRHLEFLKLDYNLTIYPGPEAYEIALLPDMLKTHGLMNLCGCIGFNMDEGFLQYAGDDSHDAEVMKLVLQHGGMAFTVGPEPLVAGSAVVTDPEALAQEILKIIGQNAPRSTVNSAMRALLL
ncbi:MAG: trehalose-phosphatase [Deltaproteobacteria bacterium]|nr:trehalose-phosphatase [Deltaproteobacteria bacterium]